MRSERVFEPLADIFSGKAASTRHKIDEVNHIDRVDLIRFVYDNAIKVSRKEEFKVKIFHQRIG